MKYSTHSFSVELATKIGLRESIILQHLYWWHQHNASVRSLCFDGRVWFFLSRAKIREAFPYLSDKVVRNILGNLIDSGLILKDHKGTGQNQLDRTNWYALTDDALWLFECDERANPLAQEGQCIGPRGPIVNNNSYYTPSKEGCVDICITPKPPKKFSFREGLLALGVEGETADAWLQVRKEKKGVNTQIALDAVAAEIHKAEEQGHAADECIRFAVVKSWCGFRWAWMEDELAEQASRSSRSNRPAPQAERNAPRSKDGFAHMMDVGRELGIIGGGPYD